MEKQSAPSFENRKLYEAAAAEAFERFDWSGFGSELSRINPQEDWRAPFDELDDVLSNYAVPLTSLKGESIRGFPIREAKNSDTYDEEGNLEPVEYRYAVIKKDVISDRIKQLLSDREADGPHTLNQEDFTEPGGIVSLPFIVPDEVRATVNRLFAKKRW